MGFQVRCQACLFLRESDPRTDEAEDGGRAIAIEEGISALVFSYAARHRHFADIKHIDNELLTTIAHMTAHHEVSIRRAAGSVQAVEAHFAGEWLDEPVRSRVRNLLRDETRRLLVPQALMLLARKAMEVSPDTVPDDLPDGDIVGVLFSLTQVMGRHSDPGPSVITDRPGTLGRELIANQHFHRSCSVPGVLARYARCWLQLPAEHHGEPGIVDLGQTYQDCTGARLEDLAAVASYLPDETLAGAGAHPAKETRSPRVSAPIEGPPGQDKVIGEPAVLTTVDRYYLAWSEYQSEHGEEPKAEQLSAYLDSKKGMTGRGGKPVSPSTLRRYLLPFRVYNLWAEQRVRNETPSLDAVAQECAAHGITAQHNKPLTADYIAEQAVDFERRWQALTRHHAQS
ncbi:hypothetical protein [Streptomyces sp. MK7]|uniref:hypothetical protein n=1 Tax=Streptomyces sp. MK7 TaxID=3067635 RepID=UPI002931865C|nr:hypothetical protein [Streptomyces sp. MK7]